MTREAPPEIRRGEERDAAAAAELLRLSIIELCLSDHGNDPGRIAGWTANKTPESWTAWVHQPRASVLVAERGGRLAGVGMCGHSGEILLNYVHPDDRFTGVSAALLEAMEAELRQHGLSRATLRSSRTAAYFYRCHGYAAVEGSDAEVLAKPLAP